MKIKAKIAIIIMICVMITTIVIWLNISDKMKNKTVDNPQKAANASVKNTESISDLQSQWAINCINVSDIDKESTNPIGVKNTEKGNKIILVGILDTGIDTGHSYLKGSVYINKNEIPDNGIDDDKNGYIDDVSGWDFVNNDNMAFDSFDWDKHGTEVAGIIKTVTSGYSVMFVPLKVIEGTTKADPDKIVEALEYAERIGVSIINCSWSGYKYDKNLEERISKSNMLFVCAAGNDSSNSDFILSYPACFNSKNILSVASIGSKGDLSTFSNYGSKICVAAPGEDILTTSPGNQFNLVKGTSFAAPFATGDAIIIKAQCDNISNTDIINRICRNVFRTEQLIDKVSTAGIIDIRESLTNHDQSLEETAFTDMIVSDNCIELFWEKTNDADTYELEIDRNQYIQLNTTSYKYLSDKKTHIFRVRAKKGNRESKWSIAKGSI